MKALTAKGSEILLRQAYRPGPRQAGRRSQAWRRWRIPPLAGQLPKDYERFEDDVLEGMLRLFDEEGLRNASGDVFGRIYEYFLAEFSKQGAHDGGEFFTPPSIVQTIVNVIEPDHHYQRTPQAGGMTIPAPQFGFSFPGTVRLCQPERPGTVFSKLMIRTPGAGRAVTCRTEAITQQGLAGSLEPSKSTTPHPGVSEQGWLSDLKQTAEQVGALVFGEAVRWEVEVIRRTG